MTIVLEMPTFHAQLLEMGIIITINHNDDHMWMHTKSLIYHCVRLRDQIDVRMFVIYPLLTIQITMMTCAVCFI